MDETGNTGTRCDPDQPIHMIGCLLVSAEKVRPFEDAMRQIAEHYFPGLCDEPKFEFHGGDLFQGEGFFKGVPPQCRVDASIDVAKACAEFAEAFGYGAIDKHLSNASDHPHRIAFQFLVERIEPWLRKRDSFGLIVADEQKEVEADILSDFTQFKRYGTTFGYINIKIERILDSVHFVRSHDSLLIQACDLATYFWNKNSVQTERLLDQFSESDSKNWVEWQEKTKTRQEKAVSSIFSELRQMTLFRAQRWPKN